MKRYFYIILFFVSSISSYDGILQGFVKDSRSGEALVGVKLTVEGIKAFAVSGLDGSFKVKDISAGKYTLACSYISYRTQSKEIEITSSDKSHIVEISLSPLELEIGEIQVVGKTNRTTDTNARLLEHTAPSIINVVSAHSIETSPDLTVANVVQRISGVSVERS